MDKLRVLACLLVVGAALAYTGCSGDDEDPPFRPDAGPSPRPDAGTDAGTEFTTFVRDLIQNQTTESAAPVETEARDFVDSEPAGAFPETFFR
jgi:hypothetical protein